MITFKTTWETLCEHHGLVQIWKISYPFGGRSWLDIFSDQIFRGVEPLQVLHISIAMFQGLTWLGICWLSFILSFICFGFFFMTTLGKTNKKKESLSQRRQYCQLCQLCLFPFRRTHNFSPCSCSCQPTCQPMHTGSCKPLTVFTACSSLKFAGHSTWFSCLLSCISSTEFYEKN